MNLSEFNDKINNSPVPVVVDFWAPWCGPCRLITPELEALKQDVGDKLVVAKVNVDDEPEIAEKFGVQSIPNLILFKRGEAVHQMVGFKDRRSLRKEIDPHLN